MKRVRRRWMSWAERNELWRRWRRGETVAEIAAALPRTASRVYAAVTTAGGIAPAPRCRSRLALTLAEREDMSRGLARGESLRSMSGRLQRAPSTISREWRRHGSRRRYRASVADRRAWANARRPKPCRLAQRPRLRHVVAAKRAQPWSPQQISGWLRGTGKAISSRALTRRIRRLPQGLVKSLTWDRGNELAAHRAFTVATDVAAYFCDPRSPWQRGSSENTHGVLRPYLPPTTHVAQLTQAQRDAIALRLNTRPRMTLDSRTPAAKLAEIVASMG